jgi:hypothetical protein
MNRITNTTKVREWVDIINKLIDVVEERNQQWETTSKRGVDTYEFIDTFPLNAKFSVIYASIELDEADYKIEGNKIIFIEPTPEEGYPIKIRYVGSKL